MKMDLGTAAYDQVEAVNARNQQLVQALNTGAHSQSEINALVSQITNERIDPTTEIRLPFGLVLDATYTLVNKCLSIVVQCLPISVVFILVITC